MHWTDDYFELETPEFCILSVDDFLQLDIKPREHILAPWLPVQGLTMIYAPRGVGKTYVALSIACAVASGGHFLKWKAPIPRSVLYIDGEMPASLMQERIKQMTQSLETPLAAPFRLLTPDLQNGLIPDISNTAHQVMLEPYLNGIDLIIVDNISTLCRSTKENDADTWAPVQEWALRMRASNRSVLFIHHAGKGGNQRGTSKREDILDTVIALQQSAEYSAKDGAAFEVHFKKARGFCGDEAEPFSAQFKSLENGGGIWTTDGVQETKYERVVSLLSEGCKQSEVAAKLHMNKSSISRYAQKAREEGKLHSCTP